MNTYIGAHQVIAEKTELHKLDGSTYEAYIITEPSTGRIYSMPVEDFEKIYICLSDDTRITESDVKSFITTTTSNRIDPKTTLVSVECKNGWVDHATSSCVDPNNYDETLGTKYGLKKIEESLWGKLGFVLQWARNGLR